MRFLYLYKSCSHYSLKEKRNLTRMRLKKSFQFILLIICISFNLHTSAQPKYDPINDPTEAPYFDLNGNVKTLTIEKINLEEKVDFDFDFFKDFEEEDQKYHREKKYTFIDNRVISSSTYSYNWKNSYKSSVTYKYDSVGKLLEKKMTSEDTISYIYKYAYSFDNQNKVILSERSDSIYGVNQKRVFEYGKDELMIKSYYRDYSEGDILKIADKRIYDFKGRLICHIYSPIGHNPNNVDDIENLDGSISHQFFYNEKDVLINKVEAKKRKEGFSGNYFKYYYKKKSKDISKIKIYNLRSDFKNSKHYFFPKSLISTLKHRYRKKKGLKILTYNLDKVNPYKYSPLSEKPSQVRVYDKKNNLIYYSKLRGKTIERRTIKYQ